MNRFPTGEELEKSNRFLNPSNSMDLKKPSRCEHPQCRHYQLSGSALYLHSSKLYAPEILRKQGRLYFWACDECVSRDHEEWEKKTVKSGK